MKIKIMLPFLKDLSKNKRYAFKSSKMKNPEQLKAQNLIQLLCKKEILKGPSPKPKTKYGIGLIWHRSTMRGDVQNFINPMVDAIKEAMGVDDNYAYIMYADWLYDKKQEPCFIIEVEYESLKKPAVASN